MTIRRDPSLHHPTTVSSAIRILEVVARLGAGVTAREIALVLRMPQATAYRLLNTLVGEEYLVRTADLRGFALGQSISDLVTAAAPPPVPTRARTILNELRQDVRFAVHLIHFSSISLRIADADPDHPLQAERELIRYPHASAAGKLLLAALPDWRQSVPPTNLPRVTGSTITSVDALDVQLAEIRHTNVACQIGELVPDLACVAVPLQHDERGPLGALALSGPVSRLDALTGHIEQAQHAAAQLSPLLF